MDSYDATGVEGSLKCWDINADLHWNVYHNDLLKFYPFVGLTYLNAKGSVEVEEVTISNSEGNFGANVGVGAQFDFGSNWAASVEAKYQIIEGGQFVPMASVIYRF